MTGMPDTGFQEAMTEDVFLMRAGRPSAVLAELRDALAVNPDFANATTPKGVTPLMLAVSAGRRDVMALLLDHGANINAQDAERSTALRWAVDEGDAAAVKFLLQRGADWTIADAAGDMPYDKARSTGRKAIAELLEEKTSQPSPGKPEPKRALDISTAAAHGKAGELRRIVVDYPEAVNWREPVTGATALRNIVVYGALTAEDAQFLISRGADVNIADNDGCTPLMHSVGCRKPSAYTDLLLAAGADPLLKNHRGETAADIACLHRNPDARKLVQQTLEVQMTGTQAPVAVRKPLMLKR